MFGTSADVIIAHDFTSVEGGPRRGRRERPATAQVGDSAKNATAALVMSPTAAHPSTFSQKPLVCSPMIARLLPTNMTSTRSGGASTPVTTAGKKSMRIGLVPTAGRRSPGRGEAERTREERRA